MQRLWRDPRFRARRLMKQPMFILIAVWTLALSTGFTQIKTTVSLRQNGVGTGFTSADAILPKGHASVVLMLFGPSVSGTHASIISRELLIQNLNSY